jgi:hypothetical protein
MLTRIVTGIGIAGIAAALVSACGVEADDRGAERTERRSLGKADLLYDPNLSCEDKCDSVVVERPGGYCACDDPCADIGDCCDDKDQFCGVPPCETIEDEAACEARPDCIYKAGPCFSWCSVDDPDCCPMTCRPLPPPPPPCETIEDGVACEARPDCMFLAGPCPMWCSVDDPDCCPATCQTRLF